MVVLYHVLHCFPVAALQPDQSRWLHFISDGPLAVYIFFVLSGFALSTAFFETGDRRVVVAAALRRYPRLTIPVFASCLIAFTLLSTGLMFNQPAGLAAGSGDWLSIHYAFTPQITDLLIYSLAIVYWDGDAPISYNAVLWTMPLEMFGSLLVFTILYIFGLATIRLIIYIVTLAVLVVDNSHLVTFILGMMLADAYRFAWLQRIRHAGSGLWIGVGFAITGFLLATGSAGLITAPYAMSLVAACFVLAVVSSRHLAGLFESPVSRFLGRISFPLYLIHLVFLCSASSWVYLTLTGWGFSAPLCATLTQLFTIIGALVAATLFEPVERLSVSASRMFAQAIMARWRESGL